MRLLSLRPDDSLTIREMALSIGFQDLVSLPVLSKLQGSGFYPGELPSLNAPAFAGHTFMPVYPAHQKGEGNAHAARKCSLHRRACPTNHFDQNVSSLCAAIHFPQKWNTGAAHSVSGCQANVKS